MEKVLVGRQPIYTQTVEVFAYEFFSKNNALTQTPAVQRDTAAAEALAHEFINVGMERVVGPHPVFVDATPDFVLHDYPWLLPQHGMVLQVAASAAPDGAFLKSLSNLSRVGYSIALKDYVDCDETRPLADMADIIKVDIHSAGATLPEQVAALRRLDVRLVASGVETHDDYRRCKEAGFDYFQGFFFCTPEPSEARPLPANRLSTLHLLSKLQDPDIDLGELEHAVGQDVAMSYRILRYLNSPINALPRKVQSLRHAIALVGTSLIRRWASVIWLQNIEEKPRELMTMAMLRAQMCQQLAASMGHKNVDQFFTVGLLSLLDALLDRPMPSILQELPLVDSVKAALLNGGEGSLGTVLKCVQAYERCDWDHAFCGGVDEKRIREAYLTSVGWARAVMQELVN